MIICQPIEPPTLASLSECHNSFTSSVQMKNACTQKKHNICLLKRPSSIYKLGHYTDMALSSFDDKYTQKLCTIKFKSINNSFPPPFVTNLVFMGDIQWDSVLVSGTTIELRCEKCFYGCFSFLPFDAGEREPKLSDIENKGKSQKATELCPCVNVFFFDWKMLSTQNGNRPLEAAKAAWKLLAKHFVHSIHHLRPSHWIRWSNIFDWFGNCRMDAVAILQWVPKVPLK